MVRDRLIEFVRETARHITTTADVSPELQQLRYCLCSVARQCGLQLGEALPQAFPGQVGCPVVLRVMACALCSSCVTRLPPVPLTLCTAGVLQP